MTGPARHAGGAHGSPAAASRVPVGVVNGRFQVFHDSHVKYVLAGRERCDFLVVGITNPDVTLTADHPANPHRSDPRANPFTYFERAVMIRESLLDLGVTAGEFLIVPFPINRPDLLRNYVPADATFFSTIYDDWGRAKVLTLRSLGLTVEVLWEVNLAEKGHSGAEVRRRMAVGEPWDHMVPRTVAAYIRSNRLDERLVRLAVAATGEP